MRIRWVMWAATFAIGAALMACGGQRSSEPAPAAPTAPTPTPAPPAAPTIRNIIVTGETPAIGATAQFTATANLSDGSTAPMNGRVTWDSSDTSVATVSQSGLVTGRGPGVADIAAVFGTTIGHVRLTISRPASVTLSGTITDETSRGVLPGIAVQIRDVVGATRSTTTGSDGRFQIAGLSAGPATLTASATGYVTSTIDLTLSADTQSDVVLRRKQVSVLTASGNGNDYVLQGKTVRLDESSYMFRGAMIRNNEGLELEIFTPGSSGWRLFLETPVGQRFAPGRYVFSGGFLPGVYVDFSSPRGGCTVQTGEFTVLEAVIGPPQSSNPVTTGRIQRVHLTFTQKCSPFELPISGEAWLYDLPLPVGR